MHTRSSVIYEKKKTVKRNKHVPLVAAMPQKIPGIKKSPPKNVDGSNIEEIEYDLTSDPKEEKKLDQIVDSSRAILFSCRTVFPFDLFPDEFSIEPAQVNLKRKIFFATHEISSIPIQNISDVIVHDTIIFAGLTVIDQFFHQNSLSISFLKKDEALKAREILQGLIVATKQEVDTGKIHPKKLKKRAEQLGQMQAIK
jgi:hypothetical protein